jgi:hypothetical protein
MRQITEYRVLLCLVFEAATIDRCQNRISSQDLSGQAEFDRTSGQVSVQEDAHARPVLNSPASPGNPVTLTGILLVDDFRCDEWPANEPKDKMMCPEGGLSQWGFITATKQYTVRGIHSELEKFERQRVTVAGTVTAATGDFPAEILEVRSIASSEVDANPIRGWIDQLRSDAWAEPENVAIPTVWRFNLKPPMIQILQAGLAAQDVLLEYVNDPQIKDQIIFLLGGVGDRKAVEPIIEAMATSDEARRSAFAHRVNLAANLALTDITVGDVIWHHGGGITIDACPDDPKSCWSAWWTEHSETFDISHTPKRRYANYPDYGIYQNPGAYSSERFIHSHND